MTEKRFSRGGDGWLIRTIASSCMHMVGVKMADLAPPRAKKAKRSTPVFRVSAEEQAKQSRKTLFLTAGVVPQTL